MGLTTLLGDYVSDMNSHVIIAELLNIVGTVEEYIDIKENSDPEVVYFVDPKGVDRYVNRITGRV